ncbi:MAG: hypothetical protein JW754_04000 [Candidatus Aenigmarchaeota archaeon]|nr:hypothetical protein [Candidatus Aenigmarchaeota archaeon]
MSWEFDFLEIEDEFLDDLLETEEDSDSKSKYDEDDEEETDYNETESFDEYQQKFEYSKKKQQNAEYTEIKDKRDTGSYSTEKRQDDLESPEERGHKWGCGCAGCQRFMRTFPEMNPSLLQNGVKDNTIKTHEKDRSSYPCGGRLHAEYQKMLKFTLGNEKGFEYSLGRRRNDVMKSLAF